MKQVPGSNFFKKDIRGFVRLVNTINTTFVIIFLGFFRQIATFFELPQFTFELNYSASFTLAVLFFFVTIYKDNHRQKKNWNIDVTKQSIKIAEILSAGLLFVTPLLILYFIYLEKNYGQYLQSNISNVFLLLPFTMTISAAISQSAYIIEQKSSFKKNILFLSSAMLLLISLTHSYFLQEDLSIPLIRILSTLYFAVLFLLANTKENNMK